jgi:hypothetical protein
MLREVNHVTTSDNTGFLYAFKQLQPLLSAPPQSLPEPAAQRQLLVPDAKMIPILALPQNSLEVSTTSITSSRPNASDMPRIQRLTRESCGIRRQIKADSVRDAEIISELKQLKSLYIPDPLDVGIPDASKHQLSSPRICFI